MATPSHSAKMTTISSACLLFRGAVDISPQLQARGLSHSVLLRNDGVAVAFGSDNISHRVPALPSGLQYVSVAAGRYHSVLLSSDGEAIAFGRNVTDSRCDVPKRLNSDVRYIACSAGWRHTVLIRNDGAAVAVGSDAVAKLSCHFDESGCCRCLPRPPQGVKYRASGQGMRDIEDPIEDVRVGMYVLGEDRSGHAALWACSGGGAWQRVPDPSSLEVKHLRQPLRDRLEAFAWDSQSNEADKPAEDGGGETANIHSERQCFILE